MLKQSLLSAILLTTACGSTDTVKSTDVKETQFCRQYSLSYDAGSQELRRSAQFRVGGVSGTTIELTEPSKVAVMNSERPLEKTNSVVFTGTYYSLTDVTASPKSSETFVWTRQNASTTNDDLSLPQPAIANVKPDTAISKSSGYDISVNIDSAGSDDRIVASLISADQNTTEGISHVLVASTTSGHIIHLSLDDLKKFAQGPAKLVVKHERTRRVSESSQDLGIYITETYTSTPISVNVVP